VNLNRTTTAVGVGGGGCGDGGCVGGGCAAADSRAGIDCGFGSAVRRGVVVVAAAVVGADGGGGGGAAAGSDTTTCLWSIQCLAVGHLYGHRMSTTSR